MNTQMNRRQLLGSIAGIAAATAGCSPAWAEPLAAKQKLFLLRYDTERGDPKSMGGFLEKVIDVHRAEEIPATFFCTGAAIHGMQKQFKAFYAEVKHDPLFDVQDHSYSHIGLGYERGKPIARLKADYERSFAVHERVFGVRPIGISRCGTSGADGPSLPGFDVTEKAKAELEMVASLGVRMINSFLSGIDGSRRFVNYAALGHPKIMGFPSGYSDTSWMSRREHGDPVEYILGQIKHRAGKNDHMPLMLHDWVAWTKAPDKELTHVKRIVDAARQAEYELVTHLECLKKEELWT